MHRFLIHAMLMSALALAGVQNCRADIIYNNGGPNFQNGDEMTEWKESDDFMLSTTQSFNHVQFWDIDFLDFSYAGSIHWQITADDGAGNPGHPG